jgi:hypothetical protein
MVNVTPSPVSFHVPSSISASFSAPALETVIGMPLTCVPPLPLIEVTS